LSQQSRFQRRPHPQKSKKIAGTVFGRLEKIVKSLLPPFATEEGGPCAALEASGVHSERTFATIAQE
jgi:hypothetical protein